MGTKRTTGDKPADIDPSQPLEIAHYDQSATYKNKRFEGDMDEFMMFDYAWTAEEVVAEYHHETPTVSLDELLPEPTVRWTFDGENPLADTTGNYPLEAFRVNDEQPNVTFESGDNICGKAARFTATSGCLRRETFPEGVLPSGKPTVTLVVRYRPDTRQSNQPDQAPGIAGWGGGDGTSNDSMFRLGTGTDVNGSARGLTGASGVVAPGTDRSPLISDRTRWYTSALTYNKTTLSVFVDGVFAASKNYSFNLTSGRFVVGSTFTGTRDYYGLGDATAPLVLFDHPFALGKNVTISTTATQDRHLIAKASSFTGVDNLQTWTATVGNREYYFRISADGTELYLSIQSGSLLMFR